MKRRKAFLFSAVAFFFIPSSFVYAYLDIIDLEPLSGSYNSWAYSINDNSQIVGVARNRSNQSRACLFDPTGNGANIDLGTFGGDDSIAWSINDSGQIVGQANDSSSHSRACLFDSTGGRANIDLGTLGGLSSWAKSINDNGWIVGWANNSSGNGRACLFDPTGNGNNIDLNTLIDPSSGWTLATADSINNNGWIVGSGIRPDGYYHAYLLTPEPTTLLLLGFGAVILKRKKTKKLIPKSEKP